MEPQQLSIANAFRALGPGGFEQDYTVNNGLMVATTSLYRYHHLERFNAQVKRRAKHHKVVPRLTRPEIHSMLKHYAASGRFFLLHGSCVWLGVRMNVGCSVSSAAVWQTRSLWTRTKWSTTAR